MIQLLQIIFVIVILLSTGLLFYYSMFGQTEEYRTTASTASSCTYECQYGHLLYFVSFFAFDLIKCQYLPIYTDWLHLYRRLRQFVLRTQKSQTHQRKPFQEG